MRLSRPDRRRLQLGSRGDLQSDGTRHGRVGRIEVTPEMVEAGIAAISKWADYYDLVAEVYVAMEAAARRKRIAAIPVPSTRAASRQ
jgi:hypothetical protein